MSYTLISSERSPFGRICRIFMVAHKIDFEFRVLNIVDSKEDADALALETPINKIPILVIDGKQKIFDSRVIINYLVKKYHLPELTIDQENFVSVIYSCLDVSVILFLMKQSGYDLESHNLYITRQKERIPANLEFLKSWAAQLSPENPKDWNYASMSLFSFLYWAKMRARSVDFEKYPHFEIFLEKFAGAPGVIESNFKN